MRPGRSRDPAQSTILWREFGASAYDLGSFSVALNYTSAVLECLIRTFAARSSFGRALKEGVTAESTGQELMLTVVGSSSAPPCRVPRSGPTTSFWPPRRRGGRLSVRWCARARPRRGPRSPRLAHNLHLLLSSASASVERNRSRSLAISTFVEAGSSNISHSSQQSLYPRSILR